MRTGFGLDFSDNWQIGIGYQMMFKKKVDYASHFGYIKVSIHLAP
jgi:hypothetical protein